MIEGEKKKRTPGAQRSVVSGKGNVQLLVYNSVSDTAKR